MLKRFSSAIGRTRTIKRKARSEAGIALAALMVGVTIMLIGLAAAAPTWHYIVQNGNEQELLFRGMQIVKAIEHSKQHPSTLKLLVDGKFLRPGVWSEKNQDPITHKPWRLIHEGNPMDTLGCGGPGAPPGVPTPGEGQGSQMHSQMQPQAQPTAAGGDVLQVAPIIGVRSTSHDQSLRIFWGKNHYDEWCFLAAQNFATVPQNVYSIRQLTYPKQGIAPPKFKSREDVPSP